MRKIFVMILLIITFSSCNPNIGTFNYHETVKRMSTNYGKNMEELVAQMFSTVLLESVNKSQINWETAGNIEGGKMVVATYHGAKIYIPAYKNGDYIEVTYIDIWMDYNGEKISIIDILF